jgi:cytochrome c oxidase cbb3-type subunit I/II
MPAKIRGMQTLGVPYGEGYDTLAINDMKIQATKIAAGLSDAGIGAEADTKLIALIAYLQRLGTDIKAKIQ